VSTPLQLHERCTDGFAFARACGSQTLPLRPYMCIMLLRMVTMNAAVFAVPWWPVHARAVWPNCLQAAVQLVCLLHAPRQIRLIRERWAHTATRARTHEE
jgi:hypothetical protein